MANLSDAYGTITMKAENNVTLEQLISFIKSSGDWEYGDYGLTLDDAIVRQDGEAKAKFSGCGRNTFSATLEYLLGNIKRYLSLNNELIDDLEAEQFSLEVEYVDSEAGNLSLYKEKNIITHQAHALLEESEFKTIYTEIFEWTWANRLSLGTETLESILESYHENILYNDSSEWELDDVENFIDEVESEIPELLTELSNDIENDNSSLYALYKTAKDKMKEWQ